jgi:hypothetical protein
MFASRSQPCELPELHHSTCRLKTHKIALALQERFGEQGACSLGGRGLLVLVRRQELLHKITMHAAHGKHSSTTLIVASAYFQVRRITNL